MCNPRFVRAASLAVAAIFAIPLADGAETGVIVTHEGPELRETPVLVPLKEERPAGSYRLLDDAGADAGRAEVFSDARGTWLAAILPRVAPGKTHLSLAPIDPAAVTGTVATDVQGKARIDFAVRGKPFTSYRTDLGPKPILYPLRGPSGAAMTRSYPIEVVAGEEKDHPHHRSFWFTHGAVNGVDFWSETPGHGSIIETSRRVAGSGQALSVLDTTDDWLDASGNKVCEDRRTLRIYGTSETRTLDYTVELIAKPGRVVLGDTKEGMFGVRVASSLDAKKPDGGTIRNAEGLANTETWGKRSPWVDYSGPVGGERVGIAILDHPESFRHPTPWHVRDYGLFAANPFGLHDFGAAISGETTIPEGQSLTFRYRVILHEGDAEAAQIAAKFSAYARPPKIEFATP